MFITGRYTATYNSLTLGQTADGIRVSHQFFKQMITGDAGGQTRQDAVFQGAEMFLGLTLLEYDAAGAQAAFWPYNSTIYDMGVIGRLDVQNGICQQIVLTALAGTPAATEAAPATFTLPQCILAENFPVELLFAPALREIPLRFRVYANSSGVFATQT